MKKYQGRDYPLSETPDPGERKPYMTKKQYKAELKEAKRQHNIQAAKSGTLAKERSQKVKDIAGAIGSVVGAAAEVRNFSRGGRGRGGIGGGNPFGGMD
jgi:hypothetical protein